MLEDAKAAETAAAELAAKRDARREAVKDFAFTTEYVEERLDRWVALSDEGFAELLDGWKAVASKKEDKVDDSTSTSVPVATAMKASRDDSTNVDSMSGIRELGRLKLAGVDVRSL